MTETYSMRWQKYRKEQEKAMTSTEATETHEGYKQVWDNWQDAKKQITALKDQLAEQKQDGKRLDELGQLLKAKTEVTYLGGVTRLYWVGTTHGATLRIAIDEAKAKGE